MGCSVIFYTFGGSDDGDGGGGGGGGELERCGHNSFKNDSLNMIVVVYVWMITAKWTKNWPTLVSDLSGA